MNQFKNHFQLFDLEPSFRVDERALAAKQRELLQATHPDRFTNSSDAEQLVAMQKTTELNDAFAILKHPVRRAQHLLELLHGIDATKEVTVKDPMFLMQQLELREDLALITSQKNTAKLMAFADEIETMVDNHNQAIQQMFDNKTQDIEELSIMVHKYQFMHKLLTEIELAEDQLI